MPVGMHPSSHPATQPPSHPATQPPSHPAIHLLRFTALASPGIRGHKLPRPFCPASPARPWAPAQRRQLPHFTNGLTDSAQAVLGNANAHRIKTQRLLVGRRRGRSVRDSIVSVEEPLARGPWRERAFGRPHRPGSSEDFEGQPGDKGATRRLGSLSGDHARVLRLGRADFGTSKPWNPLR